MQDDDKVVDPTTNMLSEFAKLIQEGKKAKEEAEAKKKQTFFEKYKIENTELNPFSFISELAKLKHEAETPQKEITQQPEMVVEEVLPEPVVEVKKQSASELLAELASLIQQGKEANKEVFEENEEHLEPFVAEMVQEIVELQQEEIKEEPKPVDLISRTVESITKVAEQSKVNEVTNLFSTSEPDKTSPNFKAIQNKLKSLEQWVSKISTAGPGSGSYWLNDLGDTDKASLQNATDGQILKFSAAIGKWTAQDENAGSSTDQFARDTANGATNLAQSAYDFANTISISGNIDSYARSQAANAIANTVYTQGVDVTQNTNITAVNNFAQSAYNKANTPQSQLVNGSDTLSLNGANKVDLPGGTAYIFSATNNITLCPDLSGDNSLEIINNVGATLNTNRSFEIRTNTGGTDNAWTFSQGGALFFPDATYQTTAFKGTAIDQTARDTANLASSNTIIMQGIDVTQNTRLNALETVNTNQNTSIGIIQGVDLTQNTQIQGIQGVDLSQNSAIAIIQGVDLTQNTNITAVNNFAQGAYDKANTAITTSGGQTINGNLTANAATAFIAGTAAESGVALQMPRESALRNMTNGSNNMYFDVSNGGSSHGAFVFRSSSAFTSILNMSPTAVTFNAGATMTGQTPAVGRSSFNVALDTVVTVDNIKYRISNQGGVFPQIASASGSTCDVCYDVLGVVNGNTPASAQNSGYILLADGTWLSIYSSHGMDARGDRLTAHITDKNASKIYRATFMKTNNSSNVDGYNIVVERII